MAHLEGSIAGLEPVQGIENLDATDIVKGHLDYQRKLADLLLLLKIDA